MAGFLYFRPSKHLQESINMKTRLYQFTAVAAGTLAISAALHNPAVSDLVYDSALTGGAVWAHATMAVGNLAHSTEAERR